MTSPVRFGERCDYFLSPVVCVIDTELLGAWPADQGEQRENESAPVAPPKVNRCSPCSVETQKGGLEQGRERGLSHLVLDGMWLDSGEGGTATTGERQGETDALVKVR